MSNDICKKHILRKVFARQVLVLLLLGIPGFNTTSAGEIRDARLAPVVDQASDPRPQPEILIPQAETNPLLLPFLRPLSAAEDTLSGGRPTATTAVASRFRKTLLLPFMSYSPEARAEIGAGLMTVGHVDKTSLRPSSLRVGFLLSQAGHRILRLNPEVFFASDSFRIWSELGTYFQPDRFYGVGPNSTDQQKEYFNVRGSRIAFSVRRRVKAKTEIGPWMELGSHEILPADDAMT
ncbi:MAG: hypothetical protein K2X47_01990, partial [Bdellovibrionales bacterium]|nr:hypothetical protein [Bdellovibrionales bacterium]